VEATTINFDEILPIVFEYNNKIQINLNDIENYVIRFGIPHYDLFSSAILTSYSKIKKEVIVGLTDNICEQVRNIMIETINSILRRIRRYYFWSLCSKRKSDDIRNSKIITYILKTYRSTVSNFGLNDISLNR